MKIQLLPIKVLRIFLILLIGASCNGPKTKISEDHPKLIKTIGDPRYGNVNCSLQDRDGNLWFGTTENGLYQYDGKSFKQILEADGIKLKNITCILQDISGKIWIGIENGICLYEGKTFKKIQIPLPKKLPANKNELYRNEQWVFSMMQTKSGKLWFATISGVFTYNGKSLTNGQLAFTPFIINAASGGFLSNNNNAEYMLEDKDGNIWFGGRGNDGVYRYDGKSVTQIKLPVLFQDGPKPRPTTWAWPQLQDKNGNIWFSNWGGAYRFDGSSFTTFTKKDGLPGAVSRIIEDKKGKLWFGGDGLSRFDGKSFKTFNPKEGLAQPGIWSVLEDKTGNFWVGTRETGLYLFDGETFNAYSEYKH